MEEDYPRTLLELERHFSTEQACREYLFDLRCRTDSFVLDVKQARAGRCSRAVFSAPAAAIRLR